MLTGIREECRPSAIASADSSNICKSHGALHDTLIGVTGYCFQLPDNEIKCSLLHALHSIQLFKSALGVKFSTGPRMHDIQTSRRGMRPSPTGGKIVPKQVRTSKNCRFKGPYAPRCECRQWRSRQMQSQPSGPLMSRRAARAPACAPACSTVRSATVTRGFLSELHRAVPSHARRHVARQTSDVTSHVTQHSGPACCGATGEGRGEETGGAFRSVQHISVGTRGDVLAADDRAESHHDDKSGVLSGLARGSEDVASCATADGGAHDYVDLRVINAAISTQEIAKQNSNNVGI